MFLPSEKSSWFKKGSVIPALILLNGISFSAYAEKLVMLDPYAGVTSTEWNAANQSLANYHSHSTNAILSDETYTPSHLANYYVLKNYAILGMSDHRYYTPPTEYDKPSILEVPALEHNKSGSNYSKYHVTALFTIPSGLTDSSLQHKAAIEAISNAGGYAIINHPSWSGYTLGTDDNNNHNYIKQRALENPGLIGMEAINEAGDVIDENTGDSYYYDDDLKIWDKTNIVLYKASGKFLWGFSADDAHQYADIGWSYNKVLINKNGITQAEHKEALKKGEFYFCHSIRPYAPKNAPAPDTTQPKITGSTVNNSANTITLSHTGGGTVQWINPNNQSVITTGNTFNFTNTNLSSIPFVRAKITNSAGICYTQPYGLGQNLAMGKSTSQSSTNAGGVSSRAVDGNTDGHYPNNSVTHTVNSYNPWWKVTLGGGKNLKGVTVWNRTDCCTNRLATFTIRYRDSNNTTIVEKDVTFDTSKPSMYIPFELDGVHIVSIHAKGNGRVLSMAEVQVWAE